jgi:hypothetical protein
VLLPEGLRREVSLPEAAPMVRVQPGPLALHSGRPVALRLEGTEAAPVALRQERAEAARPAVPAGSHRGLETPAQHPARPSAAVARKARAQQLAVPRPVEPVVRRQVARQSVEPVVRWQVARQSAEPAVRRQVEVPQVSAAQPRAAPVAEGLLSGAQAVAAAQPWVERVEAVALPSEAQAAGVEELPWAAQAAEVEELPWAAQAAGAEGLPSVAQAVRLRVAQAEVLVAAGVRRREARAEALAVRPSAAAWAAPPSTRFRGGRLAPSPWGRTARARESLRIAQPSGRWWQAARGEDLS